MGARHDPGFARDAGDLGHRGGIEPGAEAGARPGEHDGADGAFTGEALARLHQRLDQGHVQRVELVGSVQGDGGDGAIAGDGDAVGHGLLRFAKDGRGAASGQA